MLTKNNHAQQKVSQDLGVENTFREDVVRDT